MGGALAFASPTLSTLRPATGGGSLDGLAGLVHTPAETRGGPALSGLVASLLVALRLVGADLARVAPSLLLALGQV